MIIAIYKDDGPLYGGDQDMERTAPHEKAVPFTDDAAFRLADNKLSEETAQRRNPRYIKWYEVEGVIPIAAVRKGLAELLIQSKELKETAPAATERWVNIVGADRDLTLLLNKVETVAYDISCTMTALGLGAEGESDERNTATEMC